jgi:hypothetical protein
MSSCKVLPANRQAPSREEFYDQHYKLPNGYVGAWYKQGNKQGLPLIVCIHGGGTNSTFMDRSVTVWPVYCENTDTLAETDLGGHILKPQPNLGARLCC